MEDPGQGWVPDLQTQWELPSQTPMPSSSATPVPLRTLGNITPHGIHQLPQKFPRIVFSIHVVSSLSKRSSGASPHHPWVN